MLPAARDRQRRVNRCPGRLAPHLGYDEQHFLGFLGSLAGIVLDPIQRPIAFSHRENLGHFLNVVVPLARFLVTDHGELNQRSRPVRSRPIRDLGCQDGRVFEVFGEVAMHFAQ